jgi:formamidopyrimidine-DNA glycosylase
VPELPEVETLRRGLEKAVRGRRITGATVANTKVLKEQPEAEFRERVVGASVIAVNRRGKYLLLPLNSSGDGGEKNPFPLTLCVHLKMRGQLLMEPVAQTPSPYHCVSLGLDGDKGEEVRFYDMWTWGEMRALTDEELAGVAGLAGMGAEPLDPTWDVAALSKKLTGRRGPIKPLLLDQSVVAGVGNIYADESLYRAGIDPRRAAGSLTRAETERLVREIRAVLTEAVEGGGTTSDEYVDLSGFMGRYTPRVYDRGGAPCVGCGTTLTRIKLGGRGTVFCPTCQPAAAAADAPAI